MEIVREAAWTSYMRAKDNLEVVRKAYLREEALSDVIPGYEAVTMVFGSYSRESYGVLFADMRQSTERAKKLPPETTFLTMHAFIPALLSVIDQNHGHVIDLMGDGIMALWGGKADEPMTKAEAAQEAGLCGLDILSARQEVINPLIEQEQLGPKIHIGVGVAVGSVVVTKIGIDRVHDVKAFGDCINQASKHSHGWNQVYVTKKVKNIWPTSTGGRISFKENGDYYVLERN